MPRAPILVWFRQDLRLTDHRALTAACDDGAPVIPVYIYDPSRRSRWAPGGASRWWLHHSLAALATSLEAIGSRLILRSGDPGDVIPALAAETGAKAVHITRAYEPEAAEQEQRCFKLLQSRAVSLRRFSGALLQEPENVRTKAGEPFRVFTPFWKTLAALPVAAPLAPPRHLPSPENWPASEVLDDWRLTPEKPDWAAGLRASWQPGEAAARHRLASFIDGPVDRYAADRDRPDLPATSRLSPHLHFGEISPATCWHATNLRQGGATSHGPSTFLKEVAWREFSYHLLASFPALPTTPLRAEFAAFPWVADEAGLRAWQKGRTGYPIVDAGMRELWTTGWMHNRVRMIAASFLVKDLRIPWQLGADWFWDTLVDADLASNAASWQWVAGCGADAAPYFRVFNPVLQGAKFDPDGAYVRRWVPELARLPADAIHAPWQAPPAILSAAGVRLGETYPRPIVDHAVARAAALAAFDAIKSARADL